MSDERGGFCLPLRWQTPTALVSVTANHPRSGMSAATVFTLPTALTGNHDIVIS